MNLNGNKQETTCLKPHWPECLKIIEKIRKTITGVVLNSIKKNAGIYDIPQDIWEERLFGMIAVAENENYELNVVRVSKTGNSSLAKA